jgi:hypothetical protein
VALLSLLFQEVIEKVIGKFGSFLGCEVTKLSFYVADKLLDFNVGNYV